MNYNQNPHTAKAMESPEFFEELLLLRAQELVSRLMEERGVSKAQLASKLGKSKAHVTGILSDGRNLTLKTLGRVCFHLGAEVMLEANPFDLAQESYLGYQNAAADVSSAAVAALLH
jgi:transcriptional regulator with XRE-family HTH domain